MQLGRNDIHFLSNQNKCFVYLSSDSDNLRLDTVVQLGRNNIHFLSNQNKCFVYLSSDSDNLRLDTVVQLGRHLLRTSSTPIDYGWTKNKIFV